jgi:hypothetical protein
MNLNPHDKLTCHQTHFVSYFILLCEWDKVKVKVLLLDYALHHYPSVNPTYKDMAILKGHSHLYMISLLESSTHTKPYDPTSSLY